MSSLPGFEHSLAAQLGDEAGAELVRVLDDLRSCALAVLGDALFGAYLTGSFALGAGDRASDVDFLIVVGREISPGEEAAIRDVHARLPQRRERWARHLEGSWVDVDALRAPVGERPPWLYVDNDSDTVERSRHDDSWNARWVLRHAGIPLFGPPPTGFVPQVDPRALRLEAAEQADARQRWIREEPEALLNGWAQPYIVLTHARLLWAATHGTVATKNDAARWVVTQAGGERYRSLIEASIRNRVDPFDLESDRADPRLAGLTRDFVDWATSEVHARAETL